MPEVEGTLHEDHFESLERQAEAARLGMWIFIASEILLFAGLFALYAMYRHQHLLAFEEAVHHNKTAWGTAMTAVLLVSSFLVAWAVHSAREDRSRAAGWLVSGTIFLGLGFIGMKFHEYASHIRHGILPGGGTHWFETHPMEGLVEFFNLYWMMTGLHLLHVTIGLVLLSFFALRLFRGKLRAAKAHSLEMGALYWHMVDAIWVFLWPMFYLMGSQG